MPKQPKIKSKVVRSTISDPDVMQMFENVLGTGESTDLNITIVHPKYLKIVKHCGRFMTLLEALGDQPLMGKFPVEARHLAGYVADLRNQASKTFSAPDFEKLHPADAIGQAAGHTVDYRQVTKEEYEAFAGAYKKIKESNIVNTAIVTCNNLVPHKKSLEHVESLKDRFLIRSAGLSFSPLPGLPAMNFKQLYISDALSVEDKKCLLMVLHKMFTISHDVYDTMSSPDIDVDEFVQVIIESLDGVKKHIPRCDEAFNKIRESVGLLKGNFDGYYKDFVASNNPTIIMENFVLDVSKSTDSSPKVTAQFRRIISHYRKLASQQAQNPQMKSLFAQVDKNFQELEKRSRQAEAEGSDSEGSEQEASAEESSGDDGPPASGGGKESKPASETKESRAERLKEERQHKAEKARETKSKKEQQDIADVEKQLLLTIAAAEIGLGEELDNLALEEPTQNSVVVDLPESSLKEELDSLVLKD